MTQSGFGDVDFYQQKKQIVERFNAIVPKLKVLDKGYYYMQAVQRLRDALTFTTRDLGKLPVFSINGLSLDKKKTTCVLYLMARFVQYYWNFCDRSRGMEVPELDLEQLESIASEGLDVFEIKGDKHPGYYLERKE